MPNKEQPKRHHAALLVMLTAIVMQLLSSAGNTEQWQFERTDILEYFSWWRLFTGHWVHANVEHTALNLFSFIATLILFPNLGQPKRLLPLIAFSSLWISTALLIFSPDIEYYLGFSGVFYALLTAGAVSAWQTPTAWLIAVFIIAKVLAEQTLGPMEYSAALTGGIVATSAHLYGVIAGAIYSVSAILIQHLQHRPFTE